MTDKEIKNNWFERNPKKTIFITLLILVICVTHIIERYLEIKNPKIIGLWDDPEYGRYIRLKEFSPLIDTELIPGDDYLGGKDGLEKKEYRFRTDENGFIMPSKVYDDPDITLAFLGGSTTECLYVADELRFPYLSGKLLGEKLDKKVNSYNAGRSGNVSIHSVNILLNKLFPLKPDIVVMKHNINDLTALLYEGSYWNENPTRSVIVSAYSSKDIYKFSELAKGIKTLFIPYIYDELRKIFVPGATDEFAHARGKKVEIDTEFLTGEFKMNLNTFISLCRARGVTPVLMTQSNRIIDKPDRIIAMRVGLIERDLDIPYKEFKEIYNLFNATIREAGRENGVLVIDLAERIPKNNKYIYDSYHLNDEGSTLASKIISEELKKFIEEK